METELLHSRRERGKLKPKCLQKEMFTKLRGGLPARLARETRGQDLVEFAFVLPILMALMILLFWCGRAFNIYQACERAAREGARVYLAATCATCGNTQTDPTATINAILTAATLDPTQANISGPSSNQTLVNPDLPSYSQVNGVTVTVSYPLQLNLPGASANFAGYYISSTVTLQQEY